MIHIIKLSSYKTEKAKMVFIFMTPAILLYLSLFIYPTIKAFYVSLFDWNGFTTTMKFIGLDNFRELIRDNRFWDIAIRNTIGYFFIGGLSVFICAFILCGILSTKLKGRNLLRAIIFFPSIINPIAVCILWAFIFNRRVGLLNSILQAIGLGALQQTWTAPENVFWLLITILTWTVTGYYCVILLAALDRIPMEYLESAYIEGANEAVIFFKIKIPLIWDVMVTTFIFWGISAVKQFSILFVWGGGVDVPPDGATNVAVMMYMTAFGKRLAINRMGYSTAMGVVMFLMVFLLVGLISRITRKDAVEY